LQFFELEFSLRTGFWYIPPLAIRFTYMDRYSLLLLRLAALSFKAVKKKINLNEVESHYD